MSYMTEHADTPRTKHLVTWMGVVHPEAGNWYLDTPMTLRHDDHEFHFSLTRSVFQLSVELEGPDTGGDEPESLNFWANRVMYRYVPVVRAVLDALAFHLGADLTPELLSGSVDNDKALGVLTNLPDFGSVAEGSHVSGGAFRAYVNAAVGDTTARFALADVSRALRFDEDCAFHCYRALEDIRQRYADSSDSRPASWEALKTDLGIDREEFRAIEVEAIARRHGEHAVSTHEQRIRWVKWTRKVVETYVARYPLDGYVLPRAST